MLLKCSILVLGWTHARIGQMVCLGLGALLMLVGAYGAFYSWEAIAAGGGFLVTGLGLKVIFHWRQHQARRPRN